MRSTAKALSIALVLAVFTPACGGTTETTGSTGKTSGGGASNGGASNGGMPSTGGTGGNVGTGGVPAGPVACTLNSDCSGALVCAFGLCHAECASVKDCPVSQRCVQLGGGDAGPTTRICALEQESACVYNSDCAAPLICAPDQQCRNQCQADRDCIVGQTCSGGACVEPGGR